MTLPREHHTAALDAVSEMMTNSYDWGSDRRGDQRSARNLAGKLVGAITSAHPENCPACGGARCPSCRQTGRRL